MTKLLDLVTGAYLAVMSAALMFTLLGQALTGGMRLEARTAAETMSPTSAALFFVWLACGIYSGFRQVRAA